MTSNTPLFPDNFTPGESSTKQIGYVDAEEYNAVSRHFREFMWKEGFIEDHPQSRLSVMAACENPDNIATFNYAGMLYPLPQTGQMWLEYRMLRKPGKYFCITTSFRNEPNPISGRHDKIFPMFEFELPGNIDDLVSMHKKILKHFGYEQEPVTLDYDTIAKKYNVQELEHEHETRMYEEYGPVVFLKDFPMHTSPFWNMALYDDKQHAKKVDVILSGIETFGSAERATDKDEMRHQFNTISDGKYANILYSQFGKPRVEKELNDYLSYDMVERVGAGIGVTRFIRSLKMEGLLQKIIEKQQAQ